MQTKHHYRMILSRKHGVVTYGVLASRIAGNQREICAIEDITTDEGEANQLLALIMRHRVEPISLQNVVEDFLES